MKTTIIQEKKSVEEINELAFLIENNNVEKPIHMPHHHLHDVFEMYYLKKGQRCYFIKNKTYFLQAGDLILINPYEFHCTMNVGNAAYERVLLHFQKSYLSTILNSLPDVDVYQPFRNGERIIRFSPHEQNNVEILLSLMLNEFKENNPHRELHLQVMLLQLFLLILRCPNRLLESPQSKIPIQHQTILETLTYITTYYYQDLNLNFIANKFHFSPCYFSRIFKQATGMPYVEYLNKIRVNEAQKLLIKTDKSITEIAGEVGFNSLTNFGRVFKQIAKCSPNQYKNRHKIKSRN